MNLVLTHYVDSTPTDVESHLDAAVSVALDAAATRLHSGRDATRTEATTHGIRVTAGLSALNGSEVRVSGTDRLTTLQIAVPWCDTDAGTQKLWAANAFAIAVADQVALAA